MSTSTAAEYAAFFLGSRSSVAQIETLEIGHPSWPETLWIERNIAGGAILTLENGAVQPFDYYPLRIQNLGARDNLDFGLKVDLGDLGEKIPDLVDLIMAALAEE